MTRLWLCAVMVLGLAPSTGAQGFDCTKARTGIEKMVCADAQVSELDEHLGRYYSAARSALPGAESCLQADQAQWLKTVREPCRDTACLKTAYLNRLGELHALQPGATAITKIELPATPALLWIVPAALDRVAAPSRPGAKPLEATGTITDDIAANPNAEGFVLRTADGTRYPLVLLMFLDGQTPEVLSSLARQKGATFRARGAAATDDRGGIYFEPSRCVFIHRLPSPQAALVAADPEQELERVRQRVVVQGPVCADPDRPCDGFKPNELSFAIRTPFAFDRGQDKSQPFYGVILKSAPLCSLADHERLAAQALFPRHKVFLHRHLCEDFGDKVTYANVNAKAGFVAVYGGTTEAEAQRVLAQVKASGRYPDANLRRLEVIVTYQIE